MGTRVEITIADHGKSQKQKREAVRQAFEAIQEADRLMSNYRADSEVSKLNQAGYKGAAVGPEVLSVLTRAYQVSELTDGAFDITVAPLIQLWGLNGETPRTALPSDQEIERVRKLVDFRSVTIVENRVRFNQVDMRIDLGGIAKGYAVDRAVEVLRENNIAHAMVNAGGDLYCLGGRDHFSGWKVGIRHPRQLKEIIRVLEIKDKAMATSGDYERFVQIKGTRYSHIINPKTGRPVDNGVVSVTVLAGDSMTADALATGVFVLGAEKGIALLDQLDEVEGMVIQEKDEHLSSFYSKGFPANELTNSS